MHFLFWFGVKSKLLTLDSLIAKPGKFLSKTKWIYEIKSITFFDIDQLLIEAYFSPQVLDNYQHFHLNIAFSQSTNVHYNMEKKQLKTIFDRYKFKGIIAVNWRDCFKSFIKHDHYIYLGTKIDDTIHTFIKCYVEKLMSQIRGGENTMRKFFWIIPEKLKHILCHVK